MPYSGPGDLTPAPVWQDPTSLPGPVPVVFDQNAAGGYYIDPSVYDPTRPVSSDAVYIDPANLGSIPPDPSMAVPAPEVPTYADQVVIWGSNPGTVEQAVSTYAAYDAGIVAPSYGADGGQSAYLDPALVDAVQPDPSYVPPQINYYPPAPKPPTYTTVSGGVTTTVFGVTPMDASAPLKPVSAITNFDPGFDNADELGLNMVTVAHNGAAQQVRTLINSGNPDQSSIADQATDLMRNLTNTADQALATYAPDHAARDNTWLYIAAGLALLFFLRR